MSRMKERLNEITAVKPSDEILILRKKIRLLEAEIELKHKCRRERPLPLKVRQPGEMKAGSKRVQA